MLKSLAIRILSRSLLRSSSTLEPSDPLYSVVFQATFHMQSVNNKWKEKVYLGSLHIPSHIVLNEIMGEDSYAVKQHPNHWATTSDQ